MKTSKDFRFLFWSGRQDLNLRPLRPERNALAKLSYAPRWDGRRSSAGRASYLRMPLGLSITGSGGGDSSPGRVYPKRSRASSSTT